MEKQGDNISYNSKEQRDFNLPPEAPIAEALQTAKIFDEVATNLENRVLEIEADNPALQINSGELKSKVQALLFRAGQLRKFSCDVLEISLGDEKF